MTDSQVPVVGLTLHGEARDGVPPRFIRNRSYFVALEAAGAAVLGIPASARGDALRVLYDLCDAVCIPGGPDIDPPEYGEETRADCKLESDPELDAADLQLTRWALHDDKPLLGICRGMQVLNVARGGTLWQDITVQRPGAEHPVVESRDELVHAMSIEPDSFLRRIAGVTELRVNSLHHQGVHQLGSGLRVTACAPDGLVEAIEVPGRRLAVAVQCHPEELVATQEWCRRLFSELVAAARG